jgi:uncharacterized protein GlcG (DUF336 family)
MNANPFDEHDVTRRAALRGAAGLALGAAGVAMAAASVSAQSATPTAGASTVQTEMLTADGALKVVQAAWAKAREIGVPEVIAVVDTAGVLKAFIRMDGAYNASIDIAMDKAYTSASFHAPTADFGKAVSADASVMASILKAPHVNLLPGGLPLMSGKTLVGAIGCSGGSGDQDVQCAQAGVAALM